MSGNFQPILTNAGMAADAASRVTGAAKLTIAQMVIGDGGGNPVTPVATQTGLINPLDTFAVDSVMLDPVNPTVLMVTGTVPSAFAGGVVLREVGLLLADGTFYAVSSVPETYIPLASQGAARNVQLVLKFVETNGTGNVTISANPAGWATQAWVSSQIAAIALPASEPHTFISDFATAVKALIPPFPASEPHTFISDFATAAAAAAPVKSVNGVGPTAGTTDVALTPANIGAVNKAGDTMTGRLAATGFFLGASQSLVWEDLAAPVDEKIFDVYAQGGIQNFRTVNDTYTNASTWMQITRTGFAPTISFWGPVVSYVGANFPGGAIVPTMPAGDASNNAASTAFVAAGLAAAFPAGKVIAWGDGNGQHGGGAMVTSLGTAGTATAGSQHLIVTFSTPQPDTNYNVTGLFAFSSITGTFSLSASGAGTTETFTTSNGTGVIPLNAITKTTTGFTINFDTLVSAVVGGQAAVMTFIAIR